MWSNAQPVLPHSRQMRSLPGSANQRIGIMGKDLKGTFLLPAVRPIERSKEEHVCHQYVGAVVSKTM